MGWKSACWRGRACRSRGAKAESSRWATSWVAAGQLILSAAQSTSEGAARWAPSIAIDIPFPVTGGIIVRESPMRMPERPAAFWGERERAAMELKEDSFHSA